MHELVRMLTSPSSGGHRRWVGALVLAASLPAIALLALLCAPRSSAQVPATPSVEDGAGLYAEGCQSCHGPNGEGVSGVGPQIGVDATQGAGPSLIDNDPPGKIEFYLTTGYMPLDRPRDVPKRSEPEYSPEQIDALVNYVAALGGGESEPIPSPDPASGSVSEGQEIFTESCAGCHQVLGEGGVVGEGVAPELRAATDTQIAEAVRSGPYLMPRFSGGQISDSELDSVVSYVGYTRDPRDDGGWGIGHIGPIPEGLAAWIVAALALVGVARLIGQRTGQMDGEES